MKHVSAHGLVENGLWMLGSGAGRTAVALGSNLVLVWYLLPEEFGRFALTQATIWLVAGTVRLRIADIIVRESSHALETGGKDTLLSALVIESILLGLGAWCLLWVVGLWRMWAGLLVFSVIAANWGAAVFAYYERSFHYKNLALLESGAYVCSHILSAAGAVLGIGFPVLYVRLLLEAIGRFSGLAFVGSLVTFRLRWLCLSDWKALYHKFRGLWLDGWLELFFERLVILIVGWIASEQVVGYFFQARRLAVVPHSLIAPMTERVAYNYFSHHGDGDRDMHRLWQLVVVQLAFLGVVAIAVFLLANTVIPMLLGLQWAPVVPLVQAMTGIILACGPFRTMKVFCMASNRMRSFVLLGRGIQYAMLAGAMLVSLVYQVPSAFMLAVGVSAGYIVGFLALCVFSRNLSHKPNIHNVC